MKKIELIPVLCSILSLTQILPSAYAEGVSGNAGKFIGDQAYSANVFDLAAKAGNTGTPSDQPWSGTFWPLRAGSTGNPYADRIDGDLFFKLNQLLGVRAHVRGFHRRMSRLRSKISEAKLTAADIQDMAPSEKYDLYLGDADFSYTHAEWQSVSEQFKYAGGIGLWEGSCHGWATAAIYQARPAQVIHVMSLDGKYLIPFYPDDLKALSTRLWANSLVQDHTVWEGLRCQSKRPKQDPNTGKVLDATCEGVNPGDFHLSVLELVGARKVSFIVNRSNNRQVWNQPVAGYELKYFNPISNKTGTLDESVVYRASYADPYLKFRAANAKSIVGVEMKLNYITETSPSHAVLDSVVNDKIKALEVRYDLELDANGNIVGGEWRHEKDAEVVAGGTDDLDPVYNDETPDIPKYPGFLWKFEDAKPTAYSIADADLSGIDPATMDRSQLIAASKKAAQFRYKVYNFDQQGNATTVKREELRPQPLGKVVNALIDLAK